MINRLGRFIGRTSGPRSVQECRHCGTTVSGTDGTCPTCGSGEIATYEL